jgi:hypothetical protein
LHQRFVKETYRMNATIKNRLFLFVCLLLSSGALAAAHAAPMCAALDFGSLTVPPAPGGGDATPSTGAGPQDFDLARALMLPAGCHCLGGGTSPATIAAGPNCASVDSQIFQAGDSYATSRCAEGVCYESNVVYTIPCAYVPTQNYWKGEGHIRYRCTVCS